MEWDAVKSPRVYFVCIFLTFCSSYTFCYSSSLWCKRRRISFCKNNNNVDEENGKLSTNTEVQDNTNFKERPINVSYF